MAEISERCTVQKWKPTEEQLQILEALYVNVYKKPSAEQIYHITDLLKSYGDLEARNVYFWFQNRRGTDRQNKRGRLEEAMASVMFNAAKIRTELRIGLFRQKMESLTFNETLKVQQETNIKKNCFSGLQQVANLDDDYKYKDIQLTRPANTMSFFRSEARVEPYILPKYRELQEREDRNKPLQTLQLFPLEPSTTIKYADNNALGPKSSVI